MIAEGSRLLIADDDDGIRGLLTKFFEKKGFTVVGARTGQEAVDHLLAGAADVAVLDVMMPGMTGLQALEVAREAGVTTPIIIATAHGESDAIVQALELGADDYVPKPFDLAVLHARVLVRLRAVKAALPFAPTPPPPSGPTNPGVAGPPGSGGRTSGVSSTSNPDGQPWEEPSGIFIPAEGAVIDGRYELLRPIGKGSFGVVWRARHRGLEADVAVKLLNPDSTGSGTERLGSAVVPTSSQLDARQKERHDELRREGVRAARVQHPHAVRVYDVGALRDGTPYLVMELLDGLTVEELIKQRRIVSIDRAVEILIPVLEALAAAHAEGVIHRDVKPANVMLHKTGKGETVKVLDFGVAKLVDVGVEIPTGHMTGDSEASSRVVAGSPAYLAPERLRGTPYDGRADVYAVGIMLYELLTGLVPFVSPDGDLMKVAIMHLKQQPVPPSHKNPNLPGGVDAFVLRLLQKDPAKRPNALEAIEMLKDLLDLA
jgi:CheY-like chemotaxis protein